MTSNIKVLAAAALYFGCAGAGLSQPVVSDHTTPGGLAFRYAQIKDARYQTIQFGWRGKNLRGQDSKPGIMVLAPALVMQGPKGVARFEFVEDVKDLQAGMRLRSWIRGSFGFLRAPPAKMDAAAKLFARVLSDPALEQKRLDQLRTRYLDRLKRAESKAAVLESRTRSRLYYPPGPMRDLRTGDPSVLNLVTVAMVHDWRKAVLTRKGLLIAAAGKASPEQVAIQIDTLFAQLPADADSVNVTPSKFRSSDKTVLVAAKVPQTFIRLSLWSGFKEDNDAVFGQLAARTLRIRLFKVIREELGASYGVSAGFSRPLPDTYLFSLAAAVAHDKAPAALAAMRSELKRLVASGITSEELEPEKTKLLTRIKEGFRKSHRVSGWLLRAMVANRPKDTVETSLARVRTVTVEQVNAALRERIGGRKVLTVIVTPSAAGFTADCVIKAPREAETCNQKIPK